MVHNIGFFSNVIVPKSLKMAKVIPIYKDKDKEQLNIHRPNITNYFQNTPTHLKTTFIDFLS